LHGASRPVHPLPLPAVRRSQPSVFNQLYLIGQPALQANGDIIAQLSSRTGRLNAGAFQLCPFNEDLANGFKSTTLLRCLSAAYTANRHPRAR